MPFWQEALGLLVVLWLCQSLGTWMQMRHYGKVMARIAETWPDGYVGASAARGRFGKGVIAIIVASPDAIVRQVFLMEGRSVFATFQELPDGEGRSLPALSNDLGRGAKGRIQAIDGAVAQIRKALDKRGEEPMGAAA